MLQLAAHTGEVSTWRALLGIIILVLLLALLLVLLKASARGWRTAKAWNDKRGRSASFPATEIADAALKALTMLTPAAADDTCCC